MRRLLRLAVVPSLALLAACGKVESFADASAPTVDADPAAPDAEPGAADAAPDATPRGVVEVLAYSADSDGRPAAGVTVVFADPDGSIAGRKLTGDDGKTSQEMSSGGSITAIWQRAGSVRLVTIVGVEAGDKLTVGTPASAASGSTPLTVNFSPVSRFAHRVVTTCGTIDGAGDARQITVQMQPYCDRSPRDLILAATDGNGNAVSYLALSDRVGNVVDVPSGSNFRPIEGMTASLTAVPADVRRLTLVRTLRSSGQGLFSSPSEGITTNGSAALGVPIPAAPLAGDDVVMTGLFLQEAGIQAQVVRERRDVTATYGLDVGSALLPWVTAAGLDAATRTVTWTQTGGGDYDAAMVDMRYSRTVGDVSTSYSWRVIAPTSTGRFVLPDLPTEVGDIEPREGDFAQVGAVYLVRHGDESYPALRAHLDIDSGTLVGAVPTIDLDTRITVSQFVCSRLCPRPLPPQ